MPIWTRLKSDSKPLWRHWTINWYRYSAFLGINGKSASYKSPLIQQIMSASWAFGTVVTLGIPQRIRIVCLFSLRVPFYTQAIGLQCSLT